jgi:ankyrin repeat protein
MDSFKHTSLNKPILADLSTMNKLYIDNQEENYLLLHSIREGDVINTGLCLKSSNINMIGLSRISCHLVDKTDGDYQNTTPLILAVQHNNVDIVLLLLDSGASINFQLDGYGKHGIIGNGYNALCIAALNRNLFMVNLLLEKGADPRSIISVKTCTYSNICSYLVHNEWNGMDDDEMNIILRVLYISIEKLNSQI